MGGGLLNLWDRMPVQILVLLSLGLQLVLWLLAGVRRREGSHVRRFVLWLAYLMADSTAIYALGHLTLGRAASDRQLVALWAPFLLLHLGGPDNITAYELADNQLWLRHLYHLVVQVLGAAYVLYKNIIPGGGPSNMLRPASILMFAVGAVKYAERTWALKCGSIDSIRSSVKKPPPLGGKRHHHSQDRVVMASPSSSSSKGGEELDDESHVRLAHTLFHICKRAMVDFSIFKKDTEDIALLRNAELWTLTEMQLSLMYDILYTKAAVIHTCPGYCIRAISPLAITASLLLFHSHRFSGSGHMDTGGGDFVITYALFGVALFMETTSLLNALASSWTFTFLSTTSLSWLRYQALCCERWDSLRRAAICLHNLVPGLRSRYESRRWSRNIGQYNMLHLCTRPDSLWRSPLLGRLAKLVRLGGMWEQKHYAGAVKLPGILKNGICDRMLSIYNDESINSLGMLRKKWGEEPLAREQLYTGILKDSLGVELQEGIIVWHIGTDVFLAMSNRAKEKGAQEHVEAIKALSNYMMYLLVERPYMLPGNTQSRLYHQTHENLVAIRSAHCSPRKYSLCAMLRSLFRVRDDPGSTCRAAESEELARAIYREYSSRNFSHEAPRLPYVARLAMQLLYLDNHTTTDALKLILEVWTDILIYASNKCSRESHARKLSSGGELTTILWLMAEHFHHLAVKHL